MEIGPNNQYSVLDESLDGQVPSVDYTSDDFVYRLRAELSGDVRCRGVVYDVSELWKCILDG